MGNGSIHTEPGGGFGVPFGSVLLLQLTPADISTSVGVRAAFLASACKGNTAWRRWGVIRKEIHE